MTATTSDGERSGNGPAMAVETGGEARIRVLVVTSSRADWGLLAPVVAELRRRPAFQVSLAVSGQHLMSGSDSLSSIAADGVPIDRIIDMGLAGDDSSAALTQAMARAVAGMGELLDTDRPDIVMVLGDRYEIMCVVMAALVAVVPVAHLCGGDVTEGAIDDSIRHAITKLASLHFVTNSDSARRVRQLGEAESRIFTVGSSGIDRILQSDIAPRKALLSELGLPCDGHFIMVTCHPVTLAEDPLHDSRALLAAMERFPNLGILISGSNADASARAIDEDMRRFASAHDNAVFHQNLGSGRYLSALSHAAAVVGNSSSGLYEAPSFKIPTVNVGARQEGRLKAESVIDCEPDPDAIVRAIERALGLDCSDAVNPYGDGHTAQRIADVLEAIDDFPALSQKSFSDFTQ